jgi:tetratricopeptide (TPR) repeat protein/DNA-binding CsgD family transcriptional regulator
MSRSEAHVNDPLALPLEEAPRTLEYLQWLREEADPIMRSDPERYLALVDRGVTVAAETGEHEVHARFLISRAFSWRVRRNYNAARADLAEVDRQAGYLPEASARDLRGRMRNQLGFVLLDAEGNVAEAQRCFLDAIEVARELGDVDSEANFLSNLSAICIDWTGDIQGAVDHLTSAIRLCPRESIGYGTILLNLANLCYQAGDTVTARAYIDEALSVDAAGPDRLVGRFGLASLICQEEGNLDEALMWADRCVDAARAQSLDRLLTQEALCIRGATHYHRNELHASIRDYEEGLQWRIKDSNFCQGSCLLARSYAALAAGSRSSTSDGPDAALDAERKARDILQRVEEMWDDVPPPCRINCLMDISEAKALMGDYQGAYIASKQSRDLRGETYSAKVRNEIGSVRLLMKLEREQHEKEIQRIKAEQTERELGNATLQLLAQTELLHDLRTDLLKIARKIPPSEPGARELRERVKNLPCQSVDWEKFDRQFKAVHPDFIRKLIERAPDLTATEVRICTMLRMNLKSVEMAQIFCISEGGVEFHRSHIRRKLKLTKEEKLPIVLGAM